MLTSSRICYISALFPINFNVANVTGSKLH